MSETLPFSYKFTMYFESDLIMKNKTVLERDTCSLPSTYMEWLKIC